MGLRADATLTDKLHVIAQAVLRASDDRDSELQWLYLDYRPTNGLSFKLGRQRIPLFQFSEAIDVGFAYPWISLPLVVYDSFLFTDYDGLLGTYEFSTHSFSGAIDAYYGEFNGEVNFTNRDFDIEVRDLAGITGSAYVGQFNFRASYHRAAASVGLDDLQPFAQTLRQLGFANSAKSIEINDTAIIRQLSAGWENVDYFARIEFSQLNSSAFFIERTNSYYISVGYNFYPFVAHATLGKSKSKNATAPNEIPLGIDPQLDFLAQQLDVVQGSISLPDLETTSLGLRYDFRTNIAFKVDLTFTREEQFTFSQNGERLGAGTFSNAELLQVGMEWVF